MITRSNPDAAALCVETAFSRTVTAETQELSNETVLAKWQRSPETKRGYTNRTIEV
jgi:hypothetical protein